MSATEAITCLATFLFLLVFLFLLFYLWRVTDLSAGSPPKDTKEGALGLFHRASNWGEKGFVIFLYSPLGARNAYGVVLMCFATTGFAAVAAICGGINMLVLKEIRLILQDFYNFIERLLHPSAGRAPEVLSFHLDRFQYR